MILLILYCVLWLNVFQQKLLPLGLKSQNLLHHLLKQRYRLRRQGLAPRANIIAQKINALISRNRSNSLSKLSTSNTKELWAAVKKTRCPCHTVNGSMVLREPNAINKYFVNIASKDMYDPSELDHFRCDKSGDFQPLTNIEVEQLLRNTKLTAAGCDDIPAWLLRSCSFELADVVA